MTNRRRLILGGLALLAVAGVLLALRLQPSTGIDTLVSSSSADYHATTVDSRQFGSAPVVVLVRIPLTRLIHISELTKISQLEACLGGEELTLNKKLGALEPVAADGAQPYGGSSSPCGELMRTRPVKVVYGPGTFLNRAVAAVSTEVSSLTAASAKTVQAAESAALSLAKSKGLDTQQADAAAKEAGALALDQQLGALSTLAGQTGIDSTPSIDNTQFLDQIVFSSDRGGTTKPNSRFTYLFPSTDDALIQVRLRAGLSDAQQARAITLVRHAVAMPRFQMMGASYTVTGEPVVLSDLGSGVAHQLVLLLIGAVVVMALVLLLCFRRRPRLLPLVLALAAVAITFGLVSLVGASLTLAGVAVLPVLIGLGVDYGLQLQSGTAAGRLGVAGLATAAGFLALLLSPVPMVQGFGLLLILGVGVALAVAMVAVPAVGPPNPRQPEARPPAAPDAAARGAGEILAALDAAARGAGEILRTPLPALSGVLRALTGRPRLVLVTAVVLAVAGWALESQTTVQSDITKLVPADMPALQHLRLLERVTGVSGEIDVVIHAHNVATPQALAWMVSYEGRVLKHFGYTQKRGCAVATLCPALSLPDLLEVDDGASTGTTGTTGTAGTTGTTGAGTGQRASTSGLTAEGISSLLTAVPGYFQRAVITADHRYATLAFGIRLMPLARQRTVISYMRSALNPPVGVNAELAGLPVLGADADGALSSWVRRLVMLAVGVLLVGLALLSTLRSPRRVLVPLLPILLATGWSALVVYLTRIALNPISATLGVLVIAISTEFSVLLAERARRERADGWSRRTAIERAYRSTGAVILVSGMTAIAGFGVLIISNVAMLRDFGLVTLIDLSVSLAGVLLVLPAVLTVTEPPERVMLHRPSAPSRAQPVRTGSAP